MAYFLGLIPAIRLNTLLKWERLLKPTREQVSSTVYPCDRYSLAYEEFISLNTHMIQKLLKQNEELQNRVSILEQKLEAKGDENANIKI